MDRRTFMSVVAGGVAAVPLVALTQTSDAPRHLGDPAGRPRKATPKPLHPTHSTTIEFTEGVPASIDVSGLLPAGADRVQGGFFYETDPFNGEWFDHVYFDPVNKLLVYDGSPLTIHNTSNPSVNYWLGSETGPYNAHWQWPPTTMNIPQAAGGVQQAVTGGSKHTRARYCPYDGLIHIFGGDYSSAGIINDGHQDGRMLFWHWNPVTNAWGLDYPALGRPGEDQPLSPDIMGIAWDPSRQIWWITYGDARAGVQGSDRADDPGNIQAGSAWHDLGGVSNAWPKSVYATYDLQWPMFTFDPKLAQPKYTRLAYQPWDARVSAQMRENAYDDASRRLYMMRPSPSVSGVRVHYLDTALYETDPLSMPWTSVDIDLRAGQPDNLTGTGVHASIAGCNLTPMHVDASGRRLFFIDSRNPAVLALTLPGNPAGEHKVQQVADLSGIMIDFSSLVQGLLACASLPFMWVPEHRCLVLMAEPLWHHVGPKSISLTIDVDTGTVSDGPRFPSRANGQPWFTGAGCWYPPTQEIVLYGCYNDLFGVPSFALWGATPGTTAMQTMHRYAWVP